MDTLVLALSAFVISLLAGMAVYAVSCLTADSELFHPLRDAIYRNSRPDGRLRQLIKRHTDFSAVRPLRLLGFLHELISCRFCSSWWHGLWVLPMMHLLGGPWRLVLLAYLPAIGMGVILDMAQEFITRAPTAPSAENPPLKLQGMLRRVNGE